MLWLLPQHLIHTTRQHLHKLKLLVGCFLSFCVVFCKFVFLYKMCKCVPWLLSGPLTHVASQDGASEDAVDRQSDVVVAITPNPHNQTTSAPTEAGGEVSF